MSLEHRQYLQRAKSSMGGLPKVSGGLPFQPKFKNTFDLGEYLSSDGTVTESYDQFIKMLGKKLFAIDKKKSDDSTKLTFFTKCMLPWINVK